MVGDKNPPGGLEVVFTHACFWTSADGDGDGVGRCGHWLLGAHAGQGSHPDLDRTRPATPL